MFKELRKYPLTLALLRENFRKYRGGFLLLAFAIVVVTVINVQIPFFFGEFSSLLLEGSSLWRYGLWLALIYGIKIVFQFILTYKTRYVSELVSLDMKGRLIRDIVEADYEQLEKMKSGDLVQKVFSELALVQGKLLFGSIHFVKDIFFLAFLVVVIAINSFKILGLLVVSGGLLYLFNEYLGKKIQRNNHEIQVGNSRLLGYFVEVLDGKKDLFIYGLGGKVMERFRRMFGRLRTEFVKSSRYDGIHVLVIEIAFFALGMGVIWILWYEKKSVPEVVTIVSCLTMLLWPLREIIGYMMSIHVVLPSMSRVENLLALVTQFGQSENCPRLIPAEEIILAIEGIDFSYSPEKPLLKDFNLVLKPGFHLIVGKNGAGKSTLLELLVGIRKAQNGQVTLHHPAAEGRFQDHVRLVRQDVFLFDDTIWENLLLVSPGMSGENLENILRDSGMGAVFDRLPKGVQTQVGERARSLSGGEKQLINVCRGILLDPPVLLLDEITNNLSLTVIRPLLAYLKEYRKGKITVFVSHHPFDQDFFDSVITL